MRHLSIIVDNTDVEDITTFKEYNSYLSAVVKRLKAQNLRTLMLFGEYHGSFAKTFRVLFKKARALHTIFFLDYHILWMMCCRTFQNFYISAT